VAAGEEDWGWGWAEAAPGWDWAEAAAGWDWAEAAAGLGWDVHKVAPGGVGGAWQVSQDVAHGLHGGHGVPVHHLARGSSAVAHRRGTAIPGP